MNLKNKNGFALVSIVIIVAIIAITIAAMLNSVRSTFTWGGFFRKKLERRAVAESGINLIKNWLQTQAKTNLPLLDGLDTQYKNSTTKDAISVCNQPSLQNFCISNNNLTPSLFILPTDQNTLANQGYKSYRIFSRVINDTSGEKYTIEALVMIQSLSLAKIAFGIMHPTGTYFPFYGTTFDGHIHFGTFPPGQKPYFGNGVYDFKGPVTFEATVSGSETPFIKGDYADVKFEKGYHTGFNLDIETDQLLPAIQSHITTGSVPADWQTSELCLFLKDRKVERYACKPDNKDGQTDYINRYQGSPISTATIPSGGLVIYSSEDIEVKGIYDGPITIASGRDIRIAGDVIARKQKAADYNLGLVAARDVLAPHYGTNGNLPGWGSDYDKTLVPDCSVPNQGCTNFTSDMTLPGQGSVTPYQDRDNDNSKYMTPFVPNASWIVDWYSHCTDPSKCHPNLPTSLDIEAAVYAINGKFNVEGLNGPAGMEIYGVDKVTHLPQTYSLDPASPNYLYTGMVAGVPTGRKGDPLYCATAQSPAACPLGQEIARPTMDWLWIYGGLLVNDFSSTAIPQCPGTHVCGFYNKSISYNPKLLSNPPPAFPRSSAQIGIFEQWRKSYVGDADMNGNVVETPTPTPTPDESGGPPPPPEPPDPALH